MRSQPRPQLLELAAFLSKGRPPVPPPLTVSLPRRLQTADLTGCVCIVTGGRVRIGFEIVLKLLRAGAQVLTTTRFPADAAARYHAADGFSQCGNVVKVVLPPRQRSSSAAAAPQGAPCGCGAVSALPGERPSR